MTAYCDGTVTMVEKTEHLAAEPGAVGWFIRLRVEGRYWGPHGASYGGPVGIGWATEAEALAVQERLAVEYLGQSPDKEVNAGQGRWPVESYAVHEWHEPPTPAHDVQRLVCTRLARCGRDRPHTPHYFSGPLPLATWSIHPQQQGA